MATIIMRTDLLQSPKVIRLSARCSCSPILIMGGLYWLWATAQGHSNGGLISALDAEIIDHTTGIKGFGVALESVGWITAGENGVQITEFDQYFGESAKVREQSRLRTARCRAAKRDTSATRNATSNGVARNSVSEPQYGTKLNDNETKGNEKEPSSEQRARVSPAPPKLPPLPSAETWSQVRQRIMAEFPPSESPANPKAVSMAVDRLTMYGDSAVFPDNRPAAIDYLLVRVKAWANSPKCRSMEQRYRPGMTRWFGDEMYLAPDSDWEVVANVPAKTLRPTEDNAGERNAIAALELNRKEREASNGKR